VSLRGDILRTERVDLLELWRDLEALDIGLNRGLEDFELRILTVLGFLVNVGELQVGNLYFV